ncbi:MAG TPA: hypothetical protein PLC06_10730 [Promineifilum sp.]|nr:hypothetical protein [Promineifilum sp.]
MNRLTRRSLLSSAPVFGFTAIAPTTMTAAAALDYGRSDAELIRLGGEFDRLRAEYYPLRDEAHRLHHLWIDTCQARGVRLGSEAAWVIADEVGVVAADHREEPVQIAFDATVTAILAAPAATLVGLAVKAKVIRLEVLAHAVEPTEAEYRAMDWGDETVIRFCFEIERMTGGAA